jgi:hypothetical protein
MQAGLRDEFFHSLMAMGNMLCAELENVIIDPTRPGSAADLITALQHDNIVTRGNQPCRCRQTSQAGTHHHNLHQGPPFVAIPRRRWSTPWGPNSITTLPIVGVLGQSAR